MVRRRGLLEEHVHGHFEIDGPARLCERVPERACDELWDPLGLGADGGPLGDRLEERELVELLESALLCLDEWTSSSDDEERRLRDVAVGDGRDRSGDARSGRHDRHATAPPDPAPSLGGVCGSLLVPDVDDPYALVPAALVDRHDVAAREGEDRVDAMRGERPRHEATALNPLSHPPSVTRL